MSEAEPEPAPDDESSLWEIHPEEFGPADIEGNPPKPADQEPPS